MNVGASAAVTQYPLTNNPWTMRRICGMAPQQAPIEQQIEALASLMRTTRWHRQAVWLLTLRRNPDLCGTTEARSHLYHATELAQELGFPAVAGWIQEFLEDSD
jgi:hypothetical protein